MSEETFRWVITGGVLMAALSFVVMGIAAVVMLKVVQKLMAKINPILDIAKPIVQTVRDTAADLKPKVGTISTHAVEVSKLVVDEAHRYSDLSKDFATRAKTQLAHIDGAVDHTVDEVKQAGTAVKGAVLKPVREVDGLLTGFRTFVYTFAKGKKSPINRATQDEEMFI